MRVFYSGMLVLGCVLLDGCAAPQAARLNSNFAVAETYHVDPSFQVGFGILSGFDQPVAGGNWEPDDWVLLGVKVAHASGEEVWFVRLSTLPPRPMEDAAGKRITSKEFKVPFGLGSVKTGSKFNAPIGRMLVETFDGKGQQLRASVRTVPECLCTDSLLDVLAGKSPAQPRPFDMSAAVLQVKTSDAEIEQAIAGSSERNCGAELTTMLQMMGGARALLPIRETIGKHIVKKPTIIGLILAGLGFNLEARVDHGREVKSPWSNDVALAPRREVKFPVAIAGQKLFDCRMVVGPSAPPYNLTGGVLLFEAVHPDVQSNRLTVCMLAAKRLGGAKERPPELVARNMPPAR